MSENRVRIVISAEGKDAQSVVANVRREFVGLGSDAEKGGARARTAVRGMDSELRHIQDTAKSVAGVVATAFAAVKTTQLIKDSVTLAARYETLGVVMQTVGRNFGYTADEVDATSRALQQAGISMVESRQQTTKLMQAHIDLTHATDLAREAQDAAVIGNMNSSEAFAHLVTGIQTAQVEMLRTIGINVNFEEAYQTAAKAINKKTTQLSEDEKMQIRVNAVLAAGADIAGTYEAAMSTAGKQMTSFSRYTEDFKVKFGEAFGPAATEMIKTATAEMKRLQAVVQDPEVQKSLAKLGEAGVTAFESMIRLGEVVGPTFKDILDGWNSLPDVVKEVGLIGAIVGGAGAKAALVLISKASYEIDKLFSDLDTYFNASKSEADKLAMTRLLEGKKENLEFGLSKIGRALGFDQDASARDLAEVNRQLKYLESMAPLGARTDTDLFKQDRERVALQARNAALSGLSGKGNSPTGTPSTGAAPSLDEQLAAAKSFAQAYALLESELTKTVTGEVAVRTQAYKDAFSAISAARGDEINAQLAEITKAEGEALDAYGDTEERRAAIHAQFAEKRKALDAAYYAWQKSIAADFATYDYWHVTEQDAQAQDVTAIREKASQDLDAILGRDTARQLAALETEYKEMRDAAEDKQAVDAWYFQERQALREQDLGDAAELTDAHWDAERAALEQHLKDVKSEINDEHVLEVYAAQQRDALRQRELEARLGYEDNYLDYLRDRLNLEFGLFQSAATKRLELWQATANAIINAINQVVEIGSDAVATLVDAAAFGADETIDVAQTLKESLRNMVYNLTKELSAYLIKNYLVMPIVGSFVGVTDDSGGVLSSLTGSGSDSGGSIGSLLNNSGLGDLMNTSVDVSSWFGLTGSAYNATSTSGLAAADAALNGSIAGGYSGPAVSTAVSATTLGELFTGIGGGFSLGSMLNEYLGGDSTTGMLASAGGAAIGTLVAGPIGGIIGGIIGGGASGLFSSGETKTEAVGSGSTVYILGGDAIGSGYTQYRHTSSKGDVSHTTGYRQITSDEQDEIAAAWDETSSSVYAAVEALGIGTDAIDGFSYAMGFDANTAEDLETIMYGMGNAMTLQALQAAGLEGAIGALATSGEYAIDTVTRLGEAMGALEPAAKLYGVDLDAISSGFVDDLLPTLSAAGAATTATADVMATGVDDMTATATDVETAMSMVEETVAAMSGTAEAASASLTDLSSAGADATEAVQATEEQLRKLAQAEYLSELADLMGGTDAVTAAFQRFYNNVYSQSEQAQYALDYYADAAAESITEITSSATSLANFWSDYRTAMSGSLTPEEFVAWDTAAQAVEAFDAIVDSVNELNRAAEAFASSLAVRQLTAQGRSQEAEMTSLLASHEQELYDARTSGYDATQLARLAEVQLAEVRQLEAEQESERNNTRWSAWKSYYDAVGDKENMYRIKQLENAEKVYEIVWKYGYEMADLYNFVYSELIRIERAETAETESLNQRKMASDLQYRALVLAGKTDEAEALKLVTAAEEELRTARETAGVTAEQLAELERIQAAELDAYWQDVADSGQDALDKLLGAVQTFAAGSLDAIAAAVSALSGSVSSQMTDAQAAIQLVSDNISDLDNVISSLETAIDAIRGADAEAYDPAERLAYQRSVYAALKERAASGDLEAMAQMGEAGQDVLAAYRAAGTSSAEYKSLTKSILGDLTRYEEMAEAQKTAAEYLAELLDVNYRLLEYYESLLAQGEAASENAASAVGAIGAVQDLIARAMDGTLIVQTPGTSETLEDWSQSVGDLVTSVNGQTGQVVLYQQGLSQAYESLSSALQNGDVTVAVLPENIDVFSASFSGTVDGFESALTSSGSGLGDVASQADTAASSLTACGSSALTLRDVFGAAATDTSSGAAAAVSSLGQAGASALTLQGIYNAAGFGIALSASQFVQEINGATGEAAGVTSVLQRIQQDGIAITVDVQDLLQTDEQRGRQYLQDIAGYNRDMQADVADILDAIQDYQTDRTAEIALAQKESQAELLKSQAVDTFNNSFASSMIAMLTQYTSQDSAISELTGAGFLGGGYQSAYPAIDDLSWLYYAQQYGDDAAQSNAATDLSRFWSFWENSGYANVNAYDAESAMIAYLEQAMTADTQKMRDILLRSIGGKTTDDGYNQSTASLVANTDIAYTGLMTMLKGLADVEAELSDMGSVWDYLPDTLQTWLQTWTGAAYADGGISYGPQLAWVSEGAYAAEAHVPLPDGQTIPVTLDGANFTRIVQAIQISGDELSRKLSAIAWQLNKTNKVLSSWDSQGMPEERKQ